MNSGALLLGRAFFVAHIDGFGRVVKAVPLALVVKLWSELGCLSSIISGRLQVLGAGARHFVGLNTNLEEAIKEMRVLDGTVL
jgi:hypothetical protein